MSETKIIKAIKVESCWGCSIYEGCSHGLRIFVKGLPIDCPLPAWPSATKENIHDETRGYFVRLQVGTAADPKEIEVLAFPFIVEFLKRIGVEIVEEN